MSACTPMVVVIINVKTLLDLISALVIEDFSCSLISTTVKVFNLRTNIFFVL